MKNSKPPESLLDEHSFNALADLITDRMIAGMLVGRAVVIIGSGFMHTRVSPTNRDHPQTGTLLHQNMTNLA
jgi:hypothetical protein